MNKFVLASQSPRRRELVQTLGLNFRVLEDKTPETVNFATTPEEIVKELAEQKARNVAPHCTQEEIIIAADTMVSLNNAVLGKPSDTQEAQKMLSALSGNTHEVYTGFCVFALGKGKIYTDFECTQVTFKVLSGEEIARYISTGEPMDKAGAYGIQGIGSLLVERINGDYFNVMGLPLCKLGKALKEEFGISLL